MGAYLFTPTRLNTLAVGAWLAVVYRNPVRWERWMARAPMIAALSGGVMLAGIMFPEQVSLVPFSPLSGVPC
ncbi:MAG: hypothetical protein QM755_01860 [Luteolibacter sp.]